MDAYDNKTDEKQKCIYSILIIFNNGIDFHIPLFLPAMLPLL